MKTAQVLFALVCLAQPAKPAPVPRTVVTEDQAELARLVGTWELVSDTRADWENQEKGLTLTFKNDGSFEIERDAKGSGKAILKSSARQLDLTLTHLQGHEIPDTEAKRWTRKAIYQLEGAKLTCCEGPRWGSDRPTEFKPTVENGWSILVYQRVKGKK